MGKQNKKNKYATLSLEDRRKRIEQSNESKRKRLSDQNNNCASRKRNTFMSGQHNSYEVEGQGFYEPIRSPLHELTVITSCVFCNAKKIEHEPPTFCCHNGQIQIVEPDVPEDLYHLFSSQSEESLSFRKLIRAYNNIFSFTSFGVNLDKALATSNKGVYTFRAQGQIYHDLPALLPQDRPKFFQLYFYDTDNELRNRIGILEDAGLSDSIMAKLIQILECNAYVKLFRSLRDFSPIEDVHIHIAGKVTLDQRVYNAPTIDQVGAIWIEGNNVNIPFERDIVVHAHSGSRHRIKHYFSCYDSLQYPLLFARGEPGWHQDIKRKLGRHNNQANVASTSNNVDRETTLDSIDYIISRECPAISKNDSSNVSCREYYCYKLQIRPNVQSTILLAGRLLQQYCVDMYIKIETTRLDFFKKHQSQIRSELYQGIVDTVNEGETRGDKVGKRIVLPSSFIGGPRDMRTRFLNSMALVQRFGKPDLFITMTCNAEWNEIKRELKEGQRPQDRPDLTSRIFRAKLMDLKDQLFKKEIFGKVAAYVYVVEFQKRGLPHIHMLIILKGCNKIKNADQYEKYVRADIPDKHTDPALHDVVIKHMLHGPCGIHRAKSPCMVNGVCRFHYPRPFSAKTIQGKDAYPIYKRLNDDNKVHIRNFIFDNQWVVPYNPYLLLRYNCHINVEICSGLKAVKYLYKYVYKGHDRAAVHISRDDDINIINEIQEFQDARWVSAQEALWRIYEFRLNEMHPPVINLQLHLPNQQSVSFSDQQNLAQVVLSDYVTRTMLTEYFEFCKKYVASRNLLYREFPEHYVWDRRRRKWTERKKGHVISRIAAANPIEGERYYLRLLLNHVKGPTSFDDLLTVNGVHYSTFKKAAQERGLLESDNSIVECLDEAVAFQMPYEFRRLFATLLVHCEPTEVRKLWDTYFDDLTEDYRRNVEESSEYCGQRALRDVQFFLQSMGKNINAYDLPKLIDIFHGNDTSAKEILDELSVQIPNIDIEAASNLNLDQKHAFHVILERMNSGNGGMFFVDGPGGTGKTFLYRALLARVRSQKMIALATATSGVAASIIPGGRTAHSRFNIPLQTNDSTMCNISKQSAVAELIRQAKIIIWDEAPMANKNTIETVDRTFRDILENSEPFGGKVFVFGGDFRQVLPVVPRATRQQTINQSLVRSYLWEKMEKLQLTQNMRAQNDNRFAQYLIQIGNGTEAYIEDDFINLPKEIVITCHDVESPELQLINAVFPSLIENASSPDYMTQRGILSTKNEYVDFLNDKMIELFPGDSEEFVSFDQAIDDTNQFYQEEFLNTLLPNGVPPHKLILKKNCPVMLLRNLDLSNGLCNGTRMICRNFKKHIIHAEITVGQHAGKQVFLPRIPLTPANDEGYPFKFKRKQFPIRLCFAMTINKAQGQTVPNVGIYLPEHVFSHGQLYVALSRGVSMQKTKVLVKAKNKNNKECGTLTKNIVYKEVLL